MIKANELMKISRLANYAIHAKLVKASRYSRS